MGSLAHISTVRRPLIHELHELRASGIQLGILETGFFFAFFRVKSSLVERVKEVQRDDLEVRKLMDNMGMGKIWGFSVDERDLIWLKNRLCVEC